jgi:F0F1-type ATP synthase assembly protein I
MTVAQSYSKASRGKRLVFIGAIPLGVALGALTWAFAPHSPWVGWGLAVVLIVLIVIQARAQRAASS